MASTLVTGADGHGGTLITEALLTGPAAAVNASARMIVPVTRLQNFV